MFIEGVKKLVELSPLRHVLVGSSGVNGILTEQQKRFTSVIELVANPSIIFIYEPTSMLDTKAATIVMRMSKNIVDTSRTIVCTVHQPSVNILEAFDERFLLKRGGQEIYMRSFRHHSKHLIKYFEAIQGVRNIRDGYSPTTWMLEVTASAQELSLEVDVVEIYKNSNLYKRNKALIEDLSKLDHGTLFWDFGKRMKKMQDLKNAMGSMHVSSREHKGNVKEISAEAGTTNQLTEVTGQGSIGGGGNVVNWKGGHLN
ncbi:hypothetical protein V6N12_071103 [Hibiscus sabdariffa]|uniref:ABC transporter family G domain-containing protein n=1 Tax=Hibiscus sabdariffa TaxID=183260 RepID=A0ABR2FJ25_9ROSI